GGGERGRGGWNSGQRAAIEGREAVAALDSAGDALRVEARGEMVAGKGEAVGRHPVIGVGEGGREIGRARACGAIDAGLEGIALAAAQPLGEAPVGAAAGERGSHHAVAGEMIVEAAGKARGAGGEIVERKLAGSVPPLLKKTFSAVATFC